MAYYHYITDTKRVKYQKSYTEYTFDKYKLQIKKWWGWKTIAFTYKIIHLDFKDAKRYLLTSEMKYIQDSKPPFV